jgi:hypothetical protein
MNQGKITEKIVKGDCTALLGSGARMIAGKKEKECGQHSDSG